MTSIWGTFGSPGFGLDDGKIASWTETDNYGTAIDVPSIRMLDWTQEFQTAVLEGDDKITESSSRIIKGAVQMSFGGVTLQTLEILATVLGLTVITGGATGGRYEVLRLKSPQPRYVAISGRALNNKGGDGQLFIPKAVVTNIGGLKLEFGAFSLPEITFDVLDDGGSIGFGEIVIHETALAVTIPPTYTG